MGIPGDDTTWELVTQAAVNYALLKERIKYVKLNFDYVTWKRSNLLKYQGRHELKCPEKITAEILELGREILHLQRQYSCMCDKLDELEGKLGSARRCNIAFTPCIRKQWDLGYDETEETEYVQ